MHGWCMRTGAHRFLCPVHMRTGADVFNGLVCMRTGAHMLIHIYRRSLAAKFTPKQTWENEFFNSTPAMWTELAAAVAAESDDDDEYEEDDIVQEVDEEKGDEDPLDTMFDDTVYDEPVLTDAQLRELDAKLFPTTKK